MMNIKKLILNLVIVTGIALSGSYAFATTNDTAFLAQCPTVSNFVKHQTKVYSTVNNNTITWKGYNGAYKIQSFNGMVLNKCSSTMNACSVSCSYAVINKKGATSNIILTPRDNSHLFLSATPVSNQQAGVCKKSDPAQCQFNAIENDLSNVKHKTQNF